MPLRYHRLDGAEFRSIARGWGDESALAVLRAGQLSKHLLLLRWIRDGEAPRVANDDAWALLDDVARDRLDHFRHVVSHPFVGTWGARYARRDDAPTASAVQHHVVGLAASAGVRAGREFRLPIRYQPGQLLLPELGFVYGLGVGPAEVRHVDANVIVTGPERTVTVSLADSGDRPFWCAYRTLDASAGPERAEMLIEDLDPHRACFGLPAQDRLLPDDVAVLRDRFVDAWALIVSDYGPYLPSVRHCIRSLVPLTAPGRGTASATARGAFGAFATSVPDDGATLALLLIHETQHAKLNALLDLVDLVDPADTSLYHAPWREDPRPALALLHGTYAHAAVADYWRVRRVREPRATVRRCAFEFVYWLEQARRGAETLLSSTALTEHGVRFTNHLASTLDEWRSVALEPGLSDGVFEMATAVDLIWRLRHRRAPEEQVRALAAAWRAGRVCPELPQGIATVSPNNGPARMSGLSMTLRQRLVSDSADGRDNDEHLDLDAEQARLTPTNPQDEDDWAALALTYRRHGHTKAARGLTARPELVRALWTQLGADVEPASIAAWIAGGLDD